MNTMKRTKNRNLEMLVIGQEVKQKPGKLGWNGEQEGKASDKGPGNREVESFVKEWSLIIQQITAVVGCR